MASGSSELTIRTCTVPTTSSSPSETTTSTRPVAPTVASVGAVTRSTPSSRSASKPVADDLHVVEGVLVVLVPVVDRAAQVDLPLTALGHLDAQLGERGGAC